MCLVDVLIDTVQAKLRSLHEFHQRLLHNTVPLPSGVDIANTIKYFSQTLLSEYRRCDGFAILLIRFFSSGTLKDCSESPLDQIRDPDMDMRRMSSYPSLEYQNLYNAICMLVSSVDKSFESSLILILISL